MDQNCVFCKIVAGEIPCHKVYEDDQILVFLDINPVTPGHSLVIPKDHHQMMLDTPDALVQYIFTKAKELMASIKKAMQADFVVVSVVGNEVPHFHVHLIPRKNNDDLANFWPTQKYQTGQAEGVLEKIKQNL